MEYIKRIVDNKLKNKLEITGAVVIKGPKWCGKTTTGKQFSKSILEFQNPEMQENYLELVETKPSILLKGEKPKLIDEWHLVPKIWNAIKYDVDKNSSVGSYILTGSATPIFDSTLHSGVGRFSYVNMKPLSLFESNESNGKVSIKELYKGKFEIDGITTELGYEEIAFVLARGGWPNSLKVDKEKALNVAKEYIEVLCDNDISSIDGINRNASLARIILKSYARNVSSTTDNKTIYEDVMANFSEVSQKTVAEYINILKRLYIIEEIEAWHPNIRSKTAIRSSKKKSFVDPSLAFAALGISLDDLKLDVNTFGLLFENLVARDLSIYLDVINARLSFYRDRTGLECDNIIHFEDGSYALVEVKLGVTKIKEAKEHLLELENLIITNEKRLGKPKFKMVITGTNMAYVDENDILIVPIGTLGP